MERGDTGGEGGGVKYGWRKWWEIKEDAKEKQETPDREEECKKRMKVGKKETMKEDDDDED